MVQRHTLGADEAPSEGIISAVAAMEDCSPLELPPLGEATDPAMLDALLTDDSGTHQVAFQYCGYTVTATTDEITVEDPSDEKSDVDHSPRE